MSTRRSTRIFMGLLAGLFLFTSSALTIGVIYQAAHNNDKPSDGAASTPASTNNAKDKTMDSKLQGTKLTGFTPLTTQVTKVQATDSKVGDGTTVKPGATITFNYTGALASNGIIFQSSLDAGKPATYPLSQLIKGWQEGIPGMKVGGERRLVIPYSDGYGASGSQDGSIPPKSDLVFDIEVTAVKNP